MDLDVALKNVRRFSPKEYAMLGVIGCCRTNTGLQKQILKQWLEPAYVVMKHRDPGEFDAAMMRVRAAIAMSRKFFADPAYKFPYEVDGRLMAVLGIIGVAGNIKPIQAMMITAALKPAYLRLIAQDNELLLNTEMALINEAEQRLNRKKWSELK